MHMETKVLGWKGNRGIQNIAIEGSQKNIILHKRQVLKISENYVTELYDRSDRPQNIEVGPDEDVDADEKGPLYRIL